MSVLGGCRILQDTPSPFHVHRGQVACVQVLDKQHHERFHSPSITSSFDMFCSLSPVLLSFLHFFHAHAPSRRHGRSKEADTLEHKVRDRYDLQYLTVTRGSWEKEQEDILHTVK
uniref:Uncharacterized protein n=1 Tax=Oryza rufipogon TaxID=4529 RepID=A0A0E0P763_ORYRU